MNQATDTDYRGAGDIPDSFLVSIVRIGRVSTPDLDYTEGDIPLLTDITGYGYRRDYRRNRHEDPQGTGTVQDRIILSLPGLAEGAVLVGDIALLPACRLTNGVAQRAQVLQVRSYPTGLQCDIEMGAQQQDLQ